MQEQAKAWWKEAVVYQIYPRSFMDSNADGVGDIQGIIQKLDYLKDLGIDVIWVCPMYKSPQDDNGYDISDYQDIHHEFGSMEDFDQLLQECHQRNIRLIIDLVVNHTSDEHPWFIESRSSKNSKKRDWYIWRNGKDGKEPNNWESIFGGSAWEFDEKTAQYYLHLFSIKQPDLNWENKEMRQAIYSMIRWWLDKGIDGFRIDAITHTKKEAEFKDLPNPEGLPYVPSFASHMNVEGIHEYIDDLCKNTFSQYDIMTVGEANGVSAEEAEAWVHADKNKLNMLIQFEHIGLWDTDPEKRIDLSKVRNVFNRWQNAMEDKGWNALYVENHDIPRITSKWGNPQKFWKESATAIATMYFLMKGTPFIYQGQEIGMTNTQFLGPEDFDEVIAKNTFQQKRKEGSSDQEIIAYLSPRSRDNARTPMQWDTSTHAGFSSGQPWLKVNPNYKSINVKTELSDPDSVLNFYKKLIRLRKNESIFIYGKYHSVLEDHSQIYAYQRTTGTESALILCNLSESIAEFPQEAFFDYSSSDIVLSNYALNKIDKPNQLKPYESRVYLKKS